jgi:hypothetical protein
MHPNYQAPEMSYEPGEITACNTLIDALSAALLPEAERAFGAAVLRHSAESGAETLASEALSALRGILSELQDESGPLDEATRRLSSGLANALMAGSPELSSWEQADTRLWTHQRAMNLARAIATFWVNLGDSPSARHAACAALLPALSRQESAAGGMRQYLQLICSRFFLDLQQGGALLKLADHYAMQRTVRTPVRQPDAGIRSALEPAQVSIAGLQPAGLRRFRHP